MHEAAWEQRRSHANHELGDGIDSEEQSQRASASRGCGQYSSVPLLSQSWRNSLARRCTTNPVFIFLVLLAPVCIGQQADGTRGLLIKTSPAECKALPGNIFKVPSLSCFKCPDGQEPSKDGLNCVCAANRREQFDTSAGDGPVMTCFDCSRLLLSVSLDRRTCIACGNSSAAGSELGMKLTNSSFNMSSNATNRTSSRRASTADNGTAESVEAGPDSGRFLISSRTCSCPLGYVLTDFNSSGSISTAQGKYCAPCPFNSYVDASNPSVCTPCPDLYMRRSPATGACECTGGTVEDSIIVAGVTPADIPYVGKHVCISKGVSDTLLIQPSEYASQTFYSVRDVDGSRKDLTKVERSRPFMMHFLSAATRCKETRHWQSCQALANLCALTLYATDAPACKVFADLARPVIVKNVNGFNGWTQGLPWLLYGTTARDVLEATDLNREVALKGLNARMNLTLTAYRLDGTYVGMQAVSTQLVLCKGDDRQLARFSRFGSNSQITCSIDLLQLVRDNTEPLFYELWIEDNLGTDGKARTTAPALYPVSARAFQATNYVSRLTLVIYHGRFLQSSLHTPTTQLEYHHVSLEMGQHSCNPLIVHARCIFASLHIYTSKVPPWNRRDGTGVSLPTHAYHVHVPCIYGEYLASYILVAGSSRAVWRPCIFFFLRVEMKQLTLLGTSPRSTTNLIFSGLHTFTPAHAFRQLRMPTT